MAERVFDVLRHRNSLSWRMQSETPRALVMASLLKEGETQEIVRQLFAGDGYGPPPLSEAEVRRWRHRQQASRRCMCWANIRNGWSRSCAVAFGDRLLDELRALQARAPIDLRVNTLKTSRDDVLQQLRAEEYDAKTTRYSPFAIRIPSGASGLEKTQAFASGAFELQDEASQIAALLVSARPGMRVLDLAAGGGGKSLALAAAMQNEGEVLAFDDNPARLKPLTERAARAGATCIAIAEKRGGPMWGDGEFDRVLVDAPCSGTGTWRRQPEMRWRLTPERLESLKKTQAWLLADGARHTRSGGRLIYTTCSLLPCENEDQIAAFLERHSDFRVIPAREVWAESIGTEPPPATDQFFHATPLTTGTDGFFTAILERAA